MENVELYGGAWYTVFIVINDKYEFAEVIRMYEYKVEVYKVKNAEKQMNKLAKEGWRVVAVSPDIAKQYGVVVTYERKKD